MLIPDVSVLCITYNHERYIRKAIESFLNQKTTFSFEIVIHDDCSTDGTRKILADYAKKYPDIIVLILQNENQYSKGRNVIQLAQNVCRGRYIAICEGDDYWVDVNKIQLQGEFLDLNPKYSMVFCNSFLQFDDDSSFSKQVFCNLNKSSFNLHDIIAKDWFIPTQSIMYRKIAMRFQPWFNYAHSVDYSMQLILASEGDIYYINRPMSVYRVHKGGVSNSAPVGFPQMKKIQILSHFDLLHEFKYHLIIESRCSVERQLIYRKTLDARPWYIRLLSIDFYLNKLRNRISFLRGWVGY